MKYRCISSNTFAMNTPTGVLIVKKDDNGGETLKHLKNQMLVTRKKGKKDNVLDFFSGKQNPLYYKEVNKKKAKDANKIKTEKVAKSMLSVKK